MAEEDDKPEIESFEVASADLTRWQPSPEIEEKVLETLRGIMPVGLRASDQDLEKFYDLGFQRYQSGQYKAALPYFQMLNVIHPKHPKYLMAAAACCQMLHEYGNAISLYSLAAIMDEQNPMPQYYKAGCMVKMKQTFGAIVALEMGINRCTSPRYKSLKDRMEMMLTHLHHGLEEKKAAGLPLFESDTPEKKA